MSKVWDSSSKTVIVSIRVGPTTNNKRTEGLTGTTHDFVGSHLKFKPLRKKCFKDIWNMRQIYFERLVKWKILNVESRQLKLEPWAMTQILVVWVLSLYAYIHLTVHYLQITSSEAYDILQLRHWFDRARIILGGVVYTFGNRETKMIENVYWYASHKNKKNN